VGERVERGFSSKIGLNGCLQPLGSLSFFSCDWIGIPSIPRNDSRKEEVRGPMVGDGGDVELFKGLE